jgi:V/A-type H+-transporting ATPase subunit E
MSKLADILQEEVLAEIKEILAEAESKAENIVREAEKEASIRITASQKKAEAELRTAARRAESAAELTLSTARMQARGEAMTLVQKKVMAALEEIATKSKYSEVLEALAEEAMKTVEGAEALVLNPKDREKLNAWAMQKGLELRTDPRLHLGVRILTHGDQRSVENSLPERLQRAWETLTSGVAKQLWKL